jgi:hypothetical protein
MAVWLALIVFLAGVTAGLAYAVVRGILLWRLLKKTGRDFNEETARISETAAGIQAHLDRAAASSGRLSEASLRLAASRAAMDVQLRAVREARYTVRRTLWFVPGI